MKIAYVFKTSMASTQLANDIATTGKTSRS